MTAFLKDCAAIAADNLRSGRIDRRTFSKICALAGVAPAAAGFAGRAQAAGEIVVANWGGDAVDAYANGWGIPFTEDTGVEVIIDGAGPLEGKIKAMVDEDNVIWDITDNDMFSAMNLGRQGYLEKLDYSIIDKDKVRPGYWHEYGICDYNYSFVLAYNKDAFDGDEPTSWADMLDVDRFPGKRTAWQYGMGAAEAFAMASGVAPENLYPIDIPRALGAAQSIADNMIYWGSGAESQQMFLDGEVTMGCIWHTRASVLERDTGGAVTWTWADGLFCPAAWLIPRGAPNVDDAQRFIASAQDPAGQIEVLKALGNGPANPEGSAMLEGDPELSRIDPGFAPNLAQQVESDQEYYSREFDNLLGAWLDGIATG